MNQIKRVRILLVVLMLMMFSEKGLGGISSTDAGTPQGLKKGVSSFGSNGGGGFDRVNLFNGNLMISIPLAKLGGRGEVGAGVELVYNSKMWRVLKETILGMDTYIPEYGNWDKLSTPLAGGWSISRGRMVGRQSGYDEYRCPAPLTGQSLWKYTMTVLTFIGPDGSEYEFRDDVSDGQPQLVTVCDAKYGFDRGKRFHAVDGSGATFISNDEVYDVALKPGSGSVELAPSGVVILRNGRRIGIEKGDVKWEEDRNGNIVRYEYDKGSLVKIIDTLGREIRIEYAKVYGDSVLAKVTTKGIGGVDRVTEVRQSRLGKALGSGEAIKGYKELYPSLPWMMSTFNPYVIESIVIPSGDKWEFKYNSYGEIVSVKTVGGGEVRYEWEKGEGVVVLPTGREILRRIVGRAVYADGVNMEGREEYGDPRSMPVEESYYGGDGRFLGKRRHWFNGTPLSNFGIWHGAPPKTGYNGWLEGKEIKTAEIGEGGDEKIIREYEWEQREAVGWVTTDKKVENQPSNDPRLVKIRTTLKESGEVSEVEMEYDRHNNVVSEKTYDYGVGGRGSLLREVRRSYVKTLNGRNYAGEDEIHLKSLMEKEQIIGPRGIESETKYEYDQYGGGIEDKFRFGNPTRNSKKGSSWIYRGNVTRIETGRSIDSYLEYDVSGNVIKKTGPANGSGKRLVEETRYSAMNAGEEYFGYPVKGAIEVTETDGGTERLTNSQEYDFYTGQVLSSTGYNGEVTKYSYKDELDRITNEERPSGLGETRYSYSGVGSKEWVKKETQLDSGKIMSRTTYIDGMGKVVREVRNDPAGEVEINKEYDGLGRVVLESNEHRSGASETDGWTRTTYDGLGRVTKIETGGDKGIISKTGEVNTQYKGTITTVTDQGRKTRSNVRDALGRITKVVESPDKLNYETIYTYDGRGNLEIVGQGDQKRIFTYDELGRLQSSTLPESGTTKYEYDGASNLTKRTDSRGVDTYYKYDELGRILNKKYTDTTAQINYYYDNASIPGAPGGFDRGKSLGKVVGIITGTVTDPIMTLYGYDIGGRVVKRTQVIEGESYESKVDYNLSSLPTKETYPSGRQIERSYNEAGQIANVINKGTTILSNIGYTAGGEVEKQEYGNSLIEKVKYNSRLQPVTINLGDTKDIASKLSLSYEYGGKENNGNIQNIKVNGGSSTKEIEQRYEYDELNRIKKIEEYYEGELPQIDTISPSRGEQGETKTITISGKNLTGTTGINFTPNTGINVTSITSTGTSVTATVDIDAAATEGIRTVYIETSEGVSNILGFEVIKKGSGGGTGGCDVDYKDVTISGQDGKVDISVWTLGPANVLGFYSVDEAKSTGYMEFSVDLRKVDKDIEVEIGGWWQAIIELSTDTGPMKGKLEIRAGVGGSGTPNIIEMERDDKGVETGTWYSRGDWKSTVKGGGIVSVKYEFKQEGTAGKSGKYPFIHGAGWFGMKCLPKTPFNVEKIEKKGIEPKGITTRSWKEEYGYDRYGNRNSVATNDVKVPMFVNTTNNRIAMPWYEYDNAGNVTKDGTGREYEYDGENKLTKARIGGVETKYNYDGEGKRIRKEVEEGGKKTITRYVYNTGGELIAEYEGDKGVATSPTKEYVYGARGLLATVDGTGIKYVTNDHLGTGRVITDETGSVISRRDYGPFGEELGVGTSGRSYKNKYGEPNSIKQGFTGYEHDQETGLDFAQARYYASYMGRFTSPDPVMGDVYNPQSLNRYAYCVNNPIKYTDPTGLIWGYNGERNSYQWFQNDNVPEGWEQVSIGTVYTAWNGRQVRLGFNKYWNYVDEEPKEIDFQRGLGSEFAGWYAKFAAENLLTAVGVGFSGPIFGGLEIVKEASVATSVASEVAGARLSTNGVKLGKQLASEGQVAEMGKVIIDFNKLTEANRLTMQYGGNASDWIKKSSSSYLAKDGFKFETHWYENIKTGQRVEFKTKLFQ